MNAVGDVCEFKSQRKKRERRKVRKELEGKTKRMKMCGLQ
jgi:hypothetical protein